MRHNRTSRKRLQKAAKDVTREHVGNIAASNVASGFASLRRDVEVKKDKEHTYGKL